MSKLEHLKMIERLNSDQHYFIAEKIAKKGVVDTAYVQNKKITDYITDILVKETDNTFWSCKLAIIEKEQKQEKISNFNKDEQAIYFDLIQELKDVISEVRQTLTEMTAVGSLGAGSSAPQKKKEEEDEDPVEALLKKVRGKRAKR